MDELIDRIYYYNNDYETRLKIRLQEKAELDSKMALDYLKDEAREAGHAEGKAEGLKQGLAEGRAEGLAEGLAQGVSEATLKIAKALKEVNTPIDVITSVTGLSKEEVEKL
jgi:predicted transposase YdaD